MNNLYEFRFLKMKSILTRHGKVEKDFTAKPMKAKQFSYEKQNGLFLKHYLHSVPVFEK